MPDQPISSDFLGGMVTAKSYADAIKVCLRTLKNWEKQGFPIHRRGRLELVDPPEAALWLRGEWPKRRRGRPRKYA